MATDRNGSERPMNGALRSIAMRIHHLAMRTRDLARLRAFYCDTLGFAAERDDERRVWLRAGDAIVMLERAGDGEPAPPEGSMELTAFAIDAASRPSIERRLAERGIAIEARTDYTIYFRDPDGRRVAVSHYPHAP